MTQNKGERGIINAVCKFVKDHYRGTILTIVTGLVLFYVGALVLPNRVKTF
ncbi:MAG: hypothetical protein GTN76_14500, partial [Candidatus Aenigmarchaeota archaeon]|nr:hypothetical protein [Candidatus Aenigmarchaeota archaeon]